MPGTRRGSLLTSARRDGSAVPLAPLAPPAVLTGLGGPPAPTPETSMSATPLAVPAADADTSVTTRGDDAAERRARIAAEVAAAAREPGW